jgi:hypothetical protein
MECHFELVSFGIPLRVIPTSILGTLKTEDHHKWTLMRRAKEEVQAQLSSLATTASVIEPCRKPTALASATNKAEAVGLATERSESTIEAKPSTGLPTQFDVLFGRGKVKDHPGNIRLHKVIDNMRSRYELAEKWEKTVIAEEIIAIIKDASGRFLKVEGDGWVEVDMEVAREKVSHTFRSRRRPKALATMSDPQWDVKKKKRRKKC